MLFVILYKVILTFESVDEILKCDHSNKATEQYFLVTLFAVLFAMLYRPVLTKILQPGKCHIAGLQASSCFSLLCIVGFDLFICLFWEFAHLLFIHQNMAKYHSTYFQKMPSTSQLPKAGKKTVGHSLTCSKKMVLSKDSAFSFPAPINSFHHNELPVPHQLK